MVVQKTIDNLKERSKDERQVVAGGVAVTVVVILLVGWAVLFFKRIQNGSQEINFDSGAQEEFNFGATREAQDAIEASRNQSSEDLYRLRDDAAGNQLRGEGEIYLQEIGGSSDQFGSDQNF
ncbi:MAG: hypothetical protein Athens041674_516 [Parcubacteria group bacterium Athens0416_74]|nr:MAG: hypothetical protein Athens041674_516 [Parcubacteria group bacterium Athens0416_74]